MTDNKLNWDKYSTDEDKKEKVEEVPVVKHKKKKKSKKKEPVEEPPKEYTEKEKEYLSKYIQMAKNSMVENELYELIIQTNFNEQKIEEEIQHRLKLIEAKGDDYGWTEVKKKVKKPPMVKEVKEDKQEEKKEIKTKKDFNTKKTNKPTKQNKPVTQKKQYKIAYRFNRKQKNKTRCNSS